MAHKTLHEDSRETPVVLAADALVCGGGPAGVGAALAAAGHGAQVGWLPCLCPPDPDEQCRDLLEARFVRRDERCLRP